MEEIFKNILTARKITLATIAAMSVSGLIYLLDKKLGIIEDQYLATYVIFAFFGFLFLIMCFMFLREWAEQHHKEEMKKLDNDSKKKSKK